MTRTVGAMHVAKISRRHGDREYDSYLVRRSIREGRRVRHETIANVSQLPPEAIEALTIALKGVALVPAGEAFEIVIAIIFNPFIQVKLFPCNTTEAEC